MSLNLYPWSIRKVGFQPLAKPEGNVFTWKLPFTSGRANPQSKGQGVNFPGEKSQNYLFFSWNKKNILASVLYHKPKFKFPSINRWVAKKQILTILRGEKEGA